MAWHRLLSGMTERKMDISFAMSFVLSIFVVKSNKFTTMTTMQLNAEILRNMSLIAEDESMMKQLARYLRKLVAKKEDPTLMTKEEFMAKLERSEEQYRQGKTQRMHPGEDLDTFLKRVG